MFGTFTVSALADLTFLIKCVGTFVVCFHTKFRIPSCSGSQLTTVAPTATEEIRASTILFVILHVTRMFFPHGKTEPSGPGHPHCRGFTITSRHTTLGRTPLDDGLVRRRELYLTTPNTHKRQTSCLLPDSNPQSQQASGRRPTP
jgi:hypothetical protein